MDWWWGGLLDEDKDESVVFPGLRTRIELEEVFLRWWEEGTPARRTWFFLIRLTSKFHTYFKFKIVRSWFFRNLALWVVIFRILVGGGHLLYPYSTHILIRKRSNLFVISKKGGPGLHVTYFLSLHSWSFLYKIYYFPSFPSFFCLTLLLLRRICCSISHFFVCVDLY